MSNRDNQLVALQKLIDGVRKAYGEGIYTFEEAGQLYMAVATFVSGNSEPEPEEPTSPEEAASPAISEAGTVQEVYEGHVDIPESQ
jgi:hypothetical protein|tara:strand:+ start:320 stop:577 length:258 start_codon:yes stop_codon:yes gene_type:complete